MTICYVKESDYMEKAPRANQNGKNTDIQLPRTSSDTAGDLMEISHNKLHPMPEIPAFMFHHNFYQTKNRPKRCWNISGN